VRNQIEGKRSARTIRGKGAKEREELFCFTDFAAFARKVGRELDQSSIASDIELSFSGAYWYRPGEYARGGMPRMVRWPRKKSNQKIKANTELALAA
jgi:hypothetical protein